MSWEDLTEQMRRLWQQIILGIWTRPLFRSALHLDVLLPSAPLRACEGRYHSSSLSHISVHTEDVVERQVRSVLRIK